jgi:cobyrinic acid a,c-diamide synthase
VITREITASKIADYLHHEIDLDELVDWAERAMMDEDFDERDIEMLSQVIARVGLADVREFGLTWDDCEALLHQLGFEARVDVVPA